MSTPPGDGDPSGGPAGEREPEWKRRRRLAAVFGDVVPEQTSDDRDPGGPGAGKGDDWYRAEVPPHHG